VSERQTIGRKHDERGDRREDAKAELTAKRQKRRNQADRDDNEDGVHRRQRIRPHDEGDAALERVQYDLVHGGRNLHAPLLGLGRNVTRRRHLETVRPVAPGRPVPEVERRGLKWPNHSHREKEPKAGRERERPLAGLADQRRAVRARRGAPKSNRPERQSGENNGGDERRARKHVRESQEDRHARDERIAEPEGERDPALDGDCARRR
jgi:hypothetical protein